MNKLETSEKLNVMNHLKTFISFLVYKYDFDLDEVNALGDIVSGVKRLRLVERSYAMMKKDYDKLFARKEALRVKLYEKEVELNKMKELVKTLQDQIETLKEMRN